MTDRETLPTSGALELVHHTLPVAYETIAEAMAWSGINQRTAPVTYDRIKRVVEFAVLAATGTFCARHDIENLIQRCYEADDYENRKFYERLLDLHDQHADLVASGTEAIK